MPSNPSTRGPAGIHSPSRPYVATAALGAAMLLSTIFFGGCGSSVAIEQAADRQTQKAASKSTPELPAAKSEPAPGRTIETTFDDIKFPMEKTDAFDRSMLTEKVENLLKKRIRIRGYMYPTLRKRGLKEFVLVRDNMECCFGPGAALFDCILVRMNEGATAEYSIYPIAVEGEFRFEELMGPDGRPLAIYQMAATGVTQGG